MSEVDLPRLIQLLVDRLNPVLPEGTRLEAQGTWVKTFGPHGSNGMRGFEFLSDAHETMVDRVAWTTRDVLTAIQDEVVEATRGTAWPGDGRTLPMEWARVEGDILLFGYEGVDLRFDPIPLRYFMPSAGGRILGR